MRQLHLEDMYLSELGKMYAERDLVMQLHIGAIRNNSERMFKVLGADTGFDSINDFNYAPQLAALLSVWMLKISFQELFCII